MSDLPPFAPLLSAMPEPAPEPLPEPLTTPGRAPPPDHETEALEVSAVRVLNRIERRARADWRRLYDARGALLRPHDIPDDVAPLVKEITTEESRNEKGWLVGIIRKVKLVDTQKDDELLARHLKLLRDAVPGLQVSDLVALIEEGRRRALQGQPLRLQAGEVEP